MNLKSLSNVGSFSYHSGDGWRVTFLFILPHNVLMDLCKSAATIFKKAWLEAEVIKPSGLQFTQAEQEQLKKKKKKPHFLTQGVLCLLVLWSKITGHRIKRDSCPSASTGNWRERKLWNGVKGVKQNRWIPQTTLIKSLWLKGWYTVNKCSCRAL